jgi:hypothetical protein
MRCWNSAFNAQGLRVIIVVVQVGAMEIVLKCSKAFWRCFSCSSILIVKVMMSSM